MNPRYREALSKTSLRAKPGSPCIGTAWIVGGSGRRGTQLRGCPPTFGLLLHAAALSTPSARSSHRVVIAGLIRNPVVVWYWIPDVETPDPGSSPGQALVRGRYGKTRGHWPGDIRGAIQCVALDPRPYEIRNCNSNNTEPSRTQTSHQRIELVLSFKADARPL